MDPESLRRTPRHSWRKVVPWFPLILLVYLGLTSWQARATEPWDNEAWFVSPALNLLENGFMGTTILESRGTWMEGLDRHTYWILPLHVLVQAAWYKLLGFSLLKLRALSILWGAVILIAIYLFLCKLSNDRWAGLLTVALLTVDNHFTFAASLGRMDAMCAGLGWAGSAAYMCLRERSLLAAIFLGHALVAASCLTHPCGALHLGVLFLLMIYFDRTRLGFREVAIGAVPYMVGLSAWGFYISQAPAQFWSQFTGNISGFAAEFIGSTRWSGLSNPLTGFHREIFRYLAAYRWYSAPNVWVRSQVGILLFYGLGILAAFWTPAIRRHREIAR